MDDDLLQLSIHIAAVTGGLFVAWSLFGGMRKMKPWRRFGAALAAGVVSGAVVMITRLIG